jgi:hypothetical protein
MSSRTIDLEATEVEAWAAIADKVLSDCSLYLIEKCAEPEARAAVAAEAARSLLDLSQATLKWSTAVAAQTSSEKQRQAALTQKMRRDEVELSLRLQAREEAALSELQVKKETLQSERIADQLATAEHAAELRQTVHDLEGRRDELVQHVTALQLEGDNRRSLLERQKIAIAEELRELETQRSAALLQAEAQRSLFENQQQKAAEFRQHGILHAVATASAASGQAADMSPIANGTSSPRAAARQEVGIAALQTVREQLRELRESNSPPGRTFHGTNSITQMNASTPLLKASRSSALTGGDMSSVPLSPILNGSSNSSSHLSSSSSNPWKARLLKLQGDLKSLRADLGTPQQ